MRSLISSAPMLCLLLLPTAPQAGVFNGDFSSGLSGWTAQGAVTVTAGAADIGDTVTVSSALYQGVPLLPGRYRLDFDINADGLSATGAFLDLFSASLYYTDDVGTFDPSGAFGAVLALFDLDAAGPTLLAPGGGLGPSAPPLSAPWAHYSVVFDNTYAFVLPYFELFNSNLTQGDSRVLVDNVAIEAASIPEPTPLVLLIPLVPALAAVQRRRQSRRFGSPSGR